MPGGVRQKAITNRPAIKEELRGLVLKIQGSSFVDGPGIRTTIFLKGCPLRCLWCCSPEAQEAYPERNRLFPEKAASQWFGKWITVSEVMEVVIKDMPFYEASSGGVTIAGGEPTYQAAFALKLIKRCKQLNMHTALDTCGFTTSQEGFRALKEADLLLYDLKTMDVAEHERNTGVRNDVIIHNLKLMVELKKDIIIRIPLIPGRTDTKKNIGAIGYFLTSLGPGSIKEIDLLPYHRGGVSIYEMLGRDYPLGKKLRRQSDEELQETKETLDNILKGLCVVRIGH